MLRHIECTRSAADVVYLAERDIMLKLAHGGPQS
jgi:hypothetical protein